MSRSDVVDTRLRQKACRRCDRIFAICVSCDPVRRIAPGAARHATAAVPKAASIMAITSAPTAPA
jgi:hypothetical protein